MTDGEFVLLDRKVPRVDEGLALAEGNRLARELVARAGVESHLQTPGWGQIYRTFDAPISLPTLP